MNTINNIQPASQNGISDSGALPQGLGQNSISSHEQALGSRTAVGAQSLSPELDHTTHARQQALSDWWRGAVIYQVYPRSFLDTNGDGIGDLAGIIKKLDYISSLGVDALWISPFFKSPMKDYGYDISDFRQVDPMFGSLDDFDQLIKTARDYGLKVMIDQVLNHTSDQHQWFKESRSSRDNPKADWYVWADAREDGSPPNNWLSIFGGSAWEWDEHRQQYFFHNFLRSQPDLNFHNEQLRAQVLEELEFWLQRGVDGFRLDAINFCYHDKELKDNPAKPAHERLGRGFSPDNPYAAQYHYYDNTQAENLGFLQSIRALLDNYPGTVALGEINSEDSLATLAEYTQGDNRLHMGYSFELLSDEFSADYIRSTVSDLEKTLGDGWPCWAISNHDVTRVVSRWGNGKDNEQFSKLALSLAASLRGTLCVYQGEELGLTEAELEKHQLRDPYGLEFWPEFKGRDGCRTPIPWDASKQAAGFSVAEPWLPVANEHLASCITKQHVDQNSVLNYYRGFLRWRASHPALLHGAIRFYDAADDLLVFERFTADSRTLACFNLSEHAVSWMIPEGLLKTYQGGFNKPVFRSMGVSRNAGDPNKTGETNLEFDTYGFCFFDQ